MRAFGRIDRVRSWFAGLVVAGVACLTSTPLAAPLDGLSLKWLDASGNEARLFFNADGIGVARLPDGTDQPLAWAEPAQGQVCIGITWIDQTTQGCGTIAAADQGGAVLGSDGATIGTLSEPLPFGMLALIVEDATGRSGAGAFTVSDEAGNVVGRTLASVTPLPVVAGRYFVEPELDPFASVELTAAPGTEVAGRYVASGALWFTQQRSKADGSCCENRDVLLVLRPVADRQAILGVRRESPVGSPGSRTEPRSSATPETIAEAVRLAREFIDADGAKLVADDAPYAWAQMLMSKAILIRYGAEEDIERLIAVDAANDSWQPAFTAAALEMRLGTWRGGRLASLAGAGDMAAMAGLANEGDRRWDDAMLAAIPSAPWKDVSMALRALRGATPDQRIAAGRAFLVRHAAETAKAEAEPDTTKRVYPIGRGAERLLLLNSDDAADLKRVNERSIWTAPWELSELMGLVENPEALLWPADATRMDDDTMTAVCATVTALSPDVAAGAYDRMRSKLVSEAYVAMMDAGEIGSVADYQSQTKFGVYSSGCVPSDTIATYVDADFGGYLSLPAVRETWNEAEILDNVKAGSLGWQYFSQLDHLDDATFEAALAGDPGFTFAPLLGAFHKVMHFGTVQAELATPYLVDDARPYVMRLPSGEHYGGTIAGLLRLVLNRRDDGLVLTLVPDHRIAYNDFCSLAATIATNCDQSQWLVDPYAVDPTALIDTVELRGPKGAVELKPAEAAEGAVAYLAGEQPSGMPALTLFVSLRIKSYEGGPLDTVREIAFPLELTPEARRERGTP